MIGPFRVTLVDDYATALPLLRSVREAVFVREQGVPLDIELDAADPQCTHVLAFDPDGHAIGTARMTPERKIGRMAVLSDWRNAGVGAALLQALLRRARENDWTQVFLHAQAGAVDFYRRHGFVAHGERFMEAGIEHQEMRLALDQPQPVIDRAAAIAVASDLVTGARRGLWVHSRTLDPGLFDDRRLLDAFRELATRRTPGLEVQVLLHDASVPARTHAPLLRLAQRLPSVFAFREVSDPVDRAQAAAFMANDAGGYYYRALGHRFEGEAERHAPGRARQLADGFKSAWERSRPCSELRALGI
ncbi:GNAT family N-acetyltransferase [Luteimonas vadosa]|uniref:GNAT family N-acetyltransferase n=1 Tax=Luteimonas vadosa TaxID=1165507 RepID=A0ABP9DZM0_9GAMM